MTQSNDSSRKITRHAATDPEKCEEMRDKYGWNYVGWESTTSDLLKVNCLFEGDAEFPKSRMDYGEKEDE